MSSTSLIYFKVEWHTIWQMISEPSHGFNSHEHHCERGIVKVTTIWLPTTTLKIDRQFVPCFVFDGLFISLILLLLLFSCFLVSYVIWKKCTWKLLGYNFVIVQALICWVTICFTWITIKIINWIILSNPKNIFNKFTKPRYQIIQTYFSISVSSIRHLAHSDGPWF